MPSQIFASSFLDKKAMLKPFIISLCVVLAFSWLSSMPVTQNLEWYEELQKPWFNPQPHVFNIVWPVLYILMTFSAWILWDLKEQRKEEVEEALALFVFQLVANYLWPLFFFGMQSTWLGLLWIMLVWVLVSLNIMFFFNLSRKAALFLLPYWAWINFAAYLNYSIWNLNG